MITLRSLSRHQPTTSLIRAIQTLSMLIAWALVMWHCQRIGIRMALKPAFFTACIIFLVTTGLPQAVSAWMEPSGLPICIDSPSCPGAEHSNSLPRFQPTTSLFHCLAVGIDSLVSGVSTTEGLALQENAVNILTNSKQIFKRFFFIIKFIVVVYA